MRMREARESFDEVVPAVITAVEQKQAHQSSISRRVIRSNGFADIFTSV
jgi:hypothetical protein